MPAPTRRLAASAAALALLAGTAAAVAPAQADPSAYTVQTLHFATSIGPDGSQPCDVVGDVYTPAGADAAHPVPAILTTNGFGGSKDDQAGIGAAFAGRGYVVLSYSGLGFGGSACKITLDDPDYDGQAAKQLISYLGGDPGIAFTDAAHTTPAPVQTAIVHDARDHAGNHQADDPRVGMIGGSYGGGIQFATAAVDPRLDTIVPIITWNDLAYSLDPNNTAQTTGVSPSTPGAVKLAWGLLFSADGVLDGLENAQGDPSRLYPCPNFATFVCGALIAGGSTGYFRKSDIAHLQHASVASFVKKVRIPTLLMQGENDTLFNLNEAVATYQALRAQNTPVKMVWQSWGHSGSTPAPGEISLSNPDPVAQYETGRVADWFAFYLQDQPVSTGPRFAYFRNWVSYSGNAAPAYATAASYPVGTARTYRLSGSNQLVTGLVHSGSQSFVTPPAGAPSSINPEDAVGGYLGPVPNGDLPGTFATWTGPALSGPLDVAGIPTVTVRLQAPAAAGTAAGTAAAGPAGQLVLFVKVEDVAPDGTVSMINGLEAPIRVPNATLPVKVTLPGIVHRFDAGHHVRLVIAGGSSNYRGGLVPTPVTIAAGQSQTLVLPAVQ